MVGEMTLPDSSSSVEELYSYYLKKYYCLMRGIASIEGGHGRFGSDDPVSGMMDEWTEHMRNGWFYTILEPAFRMFIERNKYTSRPTDPEDPLASLNEKLGQSQIVKPPRNRIWSCLQNTRLDSVQVVILGQDPYTLPGIADGMAFSSKGVDKPQPPSLRNIEEAIRRQLYTDAETREPMKDLTYLATQGVLLLNTVMTVGDRPQSHTHFGWTDLTKLILYALFYYFKRVVKRPIFVMSWGAKSRQLLSSVLSPDETFCVRFETLLVDRWTRASVQGLLPSSFNRTDDVRETFKICDDTFHVVAVSVHPSPLANTKRNATGETPFTTNNHFKLYRRFASANNIYPLIEWLPPSDELADRCATTSRRESTAGTDILKSLLPTDVKRRKKKKCNPTM